MQEGALQQDKPTTPLEACSLTNIILDDLGGAGDSADHPIDSG
jgi:hypothetical protein